MAGRHTGYSVDGLLTLLNALEVNVDIVVRPKHHGRNVRPGVVRAMEEEMVSEPETITAWAK